MAGWRSVDVGQRVSDASGDLRLRPARAAVDAPHHRDRNGPLLRRPQPTIPLVVVRSLPCRTGKRRETMAVRPNLAGLICRKSFYRKTIGVSRERRSPRAAGKALSLPTAPAGYRQAGRV